MDHEDALRLCDRWLPLWTGNRPDELIEVYADDVFYRDPAKPDGIHGKAALLSYLRRLLARFPDWIWRADSVFPSKGGFTLRWEAEIPVNGEVIHETGLDLFTAAPIWSRRAGFADCASIGSPFVIEKPTRAN